MITLLGICPKCNSITDDIIGKQVNGDLFYGPGNCDDCEFCWKGYSACVVIDGTTNYTADDFRDKINAVIRRDMPEEVDENISQDPDCIQEG